MNLAVRAVVAPVDPLGLTIAGHVSVWEKGASTGRDQAAQVGILHFPVSLTLPSKGAELSSGDFRCDDALVKLLGSAEGSNADPREVAFAVVSRRLRQCGSDTSEFFSEICRAVEKSLLECASATSGGANGIVAPVSAGVGCRSIVDAMARVGWENIADVSETLSSFSIRVPDGRGRCHALVVNVTGPGPRFAYAAAVPASRDGTAFRLDVRDTTAPKDAAAALAAALPRYVDFWDEMDDLDASAIVLEPERPTRDATLRRVVVTKRSSVQIEIDPEHPRAPPLRTRLFGPERELSAAKGKLSRVSEWWDGAGPVKKNLALLFGVDALPLPSTERQEPGEGAAGHMCEICYAYRSPTCGAAPDRVCEQEACSRPFHSSCLLSWLSSVPGARRSFDTVFGSCPYCSSPITVSVSAAQASAVAK